MRRRLELLLPIVLLSIMVQLMAPIGAFRAFASAVTDPLYMSSICSEMGASVDDAQAVPAHTGHDRGDCCAFCAAGHGGTAALEPPQPVFVTLQRDYQRLSWLESEVPTLAARAGSNAQARAPPAFS